MNVEYIAVILAIVAVVAFSGCIGGDSSQAGDNLGYADNQQMSDGNGNPGDLPPQGIMHNRTGNWTGPRNMTGNFTGDRNRTGNWTSGNRTGPPPGDWDGTMPEGMGKPPGN
jgi:hypothetical protein